MTEIMPVPRNSHITVLRPPSICGGCFVGTLSPSSGFQGSAIAYALRMGYKVCIITGGRGATLDHRVKMLGLTDVCLDCMEKRSAKQDFFARHGRDPANVIYMGDDIPDLECMKAVGIPVCPSDAASEVIEASRYVSEFAGGHGCVRDIIEQVLRARGDWARDSRGMHSSNIAASR